jgi:hypothetical protein
MINQNERERLIIHLNSTVNDVFKVLPLFEEQNVGLEANVSSLLFGLYGLQHVIEMNHSHEYLSLLSILESIKIEVGKVDSKKSIIKREVFKSIDIIKTMVGKLEEDGDLYESS